MGESVFWLENAAICDPRQQANRQDSLMLTFMVTQGTVYTSHNKTTYEFLFAANSALLSPWTNLWYDGKWWSYSLWNRVEQSVVINLL